MKDRKPRCPKCHVEIDSLMLEALREIASNEDHCTCHLYSWYGAVHSSECVLQIAREALQATMTEKHTQCSRCGAELSSEPHGYDDDDAPLCVDCHMDLQDENGE